MLDLNSDLLLKVSNITIQAGSEIMKYYLEDLEIITKKDNSPLTQADLSSNKIIIEELKKIDETIPILSEETVIDWQERKRWNKYWLVDPLDGTKEFIKKNGEFTVNIAFIKNNKPFFGIIYAPKLKKTYVGTIKETYKVINQKNFKKIIPKTNPIKTMIISRSHSTKNESEKLKKKYNVKKILFLGSSLKFCYIAEGIAHIYPRSGTTYEWDTAAGHAIIKGVGGKVETNKGRELKYGKKDFKNRSFIAKIFNGNYKF